MSTIRHPAVAGMFYPASQSELHTTIQEYLAEANASTSAPKAIVVPHAGYIYSGPVAASAYKSLAPLKHQIKRIVLLGPSHRVAFNGLAAPSTDFFETPLGNIAIDKKAIEQISQFSQVLISDVAHQDEHSLEVQLPFLQEVLGDFTLVPLVVGDTNPDDVAEVIDALWSPEDTMIVISSDLSHYHPYIDAQQIDSATSEAILSLHPEKIGYEDACGRSPLNGLLTLAKRKNLSAEMLDLRNSGDTAGSHDRVVGYGAYAFH